MEAGLPGDEFGGGFSNVVVRWFRSVRNDGQRGRFENRVNAEEHFEIRLPSVECRLYHA